MAFVQIGNIAFSRKIFFKLPFPFSGKRQLFFCLSPITKSGVIRTFVVILLSFSHMPFNISTFVLGDNFFHIAVGTDGALGLMSLKSQANHISSHCMEPLGTNHKILWHARAFSFHRTLLKHLWLLPIGLLMMERQLGIG